MSPVFLSWRKKSNVCPQGLQRWSLNSPVSSCLGLSLWHKYWGKWYLSLSLLSYGIQVVFILWTTPKGGLAMHSHRTSWNSTYSFQSRWDYCFLRTQWLQPSKVIFHSTDTHQPLHMYEALVQLLIQQRTEQTGLSLTVPRCMLWGLCRITG